MGNWEQKSTQLLVRKININLFQNYIISSNVSAYFKAIFSEW